MEKNSLNNVEGQDELLWTSALQTALDEQIQLEMYNFAFYQSLANYLATAQVGLLGLSAHFKHEADEELKHARHFMDYQTQRGGQVGSISVVFPNVEDLKTAENTVVASYKKALEQEKVTYCSLLKLHNKAEEDPALQDFVEEYLAEQLKGQEELNNRIRMLELGGPVMCAIHENELQKK